MGAIITITDLAKERADAIVADFFDRFGSIPTPYCGFCSYGKDPSEWRVKRVDKVSVEYVHFMDSININLECHGQKETVVVPRETYPFYSGFHVREAFKYKPELFKGKHLIDAAKAKMGSKPKSENKEFAVAPSVGVAHPDFCDVVESEKDKLK